MAGSRTVLVPYTRAHVEVYHSWMKDAELRRLTCSERLSFEEEVANQVSWREDPKKLTFIILDSDTGKMCGDVNLYINGGGDEEAIEDIEAEIEVMIAHKHYRRHGMAKDAVLLMINYVDSDISKLGIRKFVAKILQDNTPSIKLFQKIGFKHIRDLKVFDEVHYGLDVRDTLIKKTEWSEEKYSATRYATMGHYSATPSYLRDEKLNQTI